jgi:hypothetical protein
VFVFAALWLAAGVLVRAEAPVEPAVPSVEKASAAEQVLVLKSGGTLRGQISIEGDRYHVTRANGQIDVPAPKVGFVCDSLEDAYEQQRNQFPHSTADAHLDLADWCLRYDLVSQAERELADAHALEPKNGKLALLERRLTVARQSKDPQPTTENSEQRDTERAALELKQLEAKVAELPEGVVERFGRKVQPILVNNCTASGCHQPGGKQEFQLDRAVLHGLSNRRTTLRNLTATLALVDHASPQISTLLTVPTSPHGGMKQPIFGSRQGEQLRQLQEWVALVTNTLSSNEDVAAGDEESNPKPKPIDHHAPKHTRAAVSHVAGHRTPIDATKFAIGADGVNRKPISAESDAATEKSDVVPASDEQLETLFPSRPLRRGVERAPPKPQDPFDPEIFNRQSKNAANGAAGSAEQQPSAR